MTNLATKPIPKLFREYFTPTLLGMLSLCAVTAIDGIFIGHGVGSDGLAAVNIAYAPAMLLTGAALMLGMGSSVISSIALAQKNVSKAREHCTGAMLGIGIVAGLFVLICELFPVRVAHLLGSSQALIPLVCDYMKWLFPGLLFSAWDAVALFAIRLDGSPKFAMWCNIIPGVLNVLLDYIFIFPLGMGIKGAAIATCISMAVGGLMGLYYMAFRAKVIRLCAVDFASLWANLISQCRIGISAFLGESMMGILMFTGNILFMHYIGEAGVGAFSLACYYSPFIFMIGNAIAQSAQPIVSFNLGRGNMLRVKQARNLSIFISLAFGIVVSLAFILAPEFFVRLFLGESNPVAYEIALKGLPIFASGFTFFIFNVAAIGYLQSIKRAKASMLLALLRTIIVLVPVFILLPILIGSNGLWLALSVSEAMCSLCIFVFWFRNMLCKTHE